MKLSRASKRAFTLVELLITLGIFAVLALITFGVMGKMRVKAKDVGCASNLRQIGVALLSYAGDHRQTLPYSPGQYPYNAPVTIARALVGTYGEAGYLTWNGDRKVYWWSDAMLCPSDPNAALYRKIYYYPGSYVYRQNEEGGDAGVTPINLLSRRIEQMGYKRWVVMDRCMLGAAGLEKPFPGLALGQPLPAGRWEPDRRRYASYWHENAVNVLYEDGSVALRQSSESVTR